MHEFCNGNRFRQSSIPKIFDIKKSSAPKNLQIQKILDPKNLEVVQAVAAKKLRKNEIVSMMIMPQQARDDNYSADDRLSSPP